MDKHPEDLAEYVLDALTPERVAAIEEHIAGCAVCARAIVAEAQLEEALRQAAPSFGRLRRRHQRRRVVVAVAASTAFAAALLAWLAPLSPVEPAAALVVACPMERDQQDCADEASRHGLIVQYAAPVDVPRFELLSPEVTP
jgi:hypothetical protein